MQQQQHKKQRATDTDSVYNARMCIRAACAYLTGPRK